MRFISYIHLTGIGIGESDQSHGHNNKANCNVLVCFGQQHFDSAIKKQLN